ncbi:MAG: SpoVR family protein [bacterium]|nr:SpoVR family protein [bacterium]
MELIDQHTKAIMEGCKERARDAGLRFEDETLEYIVTNRDLLELSPKVMIPTLYDYWVHDVDVLKEKGKYELYPSNPYETVINTRPAISFYNDNNPDWLNVMIFYHVLGHIDFFQNNAYFRNTWDYDFTGKALSDKRLIAKLRSEKGRWVDYVIEFSRSIDNMVGYYDSLSRLHRKEPQKIQKRLDFYFDVFLQSEKKVHTHEYVKEVEAYNKAAKDFGENAGEETFFAEVKRKYPEFDSLFEKYLEDKTESKLDIIQYILEHSEFLEKDENRWMKTVIEVVRSTSLFFQPQIRSKIMNEGWASYWHQKLFLSDQRIKGHEVEFARVDSGVTSMPRVGLNPYALGLRLFHYIEEMSEKGKISYDFQRLKDTKIRKDYDQKTGKGHDYIFQLREDFCDYLFINTYLDQDFLEKHNLFVAGKRLNRQRMVWEYYVKSRKAEDYRQMVLDSLYHPPFIEIDEEKCKNGVLYLNHRFEGKPLYPDFIPNTMMGLEYLWGDSVKLETSEVVPTPKPQKPAAGTEKKKELKFRRVLYTMQKKKISKKTI